MSKISSRKYSFTALGLIFGTALGSVLSFIVTGTVSWWIGAGTAAGIVVGAAIDSHLASKQKNTGDD